MKWMHVNIAMAALALMTISIAPVASAQGKSSFDTAVQKADAKMNHGMKSAPVNGDPDHDFMTKMIPHHQGAIDMARAELQYGKDPKVRQMARKMIIDQEKDIAKMKKQLRMMRG